MICNKTEFVRHYSELIRGKDFVEYESYYENSVIRFWKAFDRIQRLDLPPSPKVLDIGGGIMGVLLARIHGMHVRVISMYLPVVMVFPIRIIFRERLA